LNGIQEVEGSTPFSSTRPVVLFLIHPERVSLRIAPFLLFSSSEILISRFLLRASSSSMPVATNALREDLAAFMTARSQRCPRDPSRREFEAVVWRGTRRSERCRRVVTGWSSPDGRRLRDACSAPRRTTVSRLRAGARWIHALRIKEKGPACRAFSKSWLRRD
jgi:hypothetical protein